jgi:hypothetical protein
VLILGYCGGSPADAGLCDPQPGLRAYYFAHFLIIVPIISRLERPKPLPNSITEAVLGEAWRRADERNGLERVRGIWIKMTSLFIRSIKFIIGGGFAFVLMIALFGTITG